MMEEGKTSNQRSHQKNRDGQKAGRGRNSPGRRSASQAYERHCSATTCRQSARRLHYNHDDDDEDDGEDHNEDDVDDFNEDDVDGDDNNTDTAPRRRDVSLRDDRTTRRHSTSA